MNNDIQETGQANNHHNESIEQRPRRPLRTAALIAGSVTLLGLVVKALFIASQYLASSSDPIQFITGNLVNVLIFIAIVAQVLIYRKQRDIMEQQWQAMRESVKAAERATEIAQQNMIYAQRAYVTIPDGVVTNEPNARFRLRVENSDNTPASRVEIKVQIEIREHSFEPPLNVGENITLGRLGVIAPKHYYSFEIPRPTKTEEQRRLWLEKKVRFYCCGVIQYNDIFKEQTRHTWFCLSEGNLNEQGLTELRPCLKGNEAD